MNSAGKKNTTISKNITTFFNSEKKLKNVPLLLKQLLSVYLPVDFNKDTN